MVCLHCLRTEKTTLFDR